MNIFGTFIHAVVMAAFNSSTEVIASMFLWIAFLSRSHIFSIIFISGDCAGHHSGLSVSELIFNGRPCLVNWRIDVMEDEVLWWKVFGSNWSQVVLQYILIPQSIKISFYKCQSAHSVVWNTSPDHYSKFIPRRCVHSFRLPFFSGFSPHIDAFISPNLHFAFITKYNSVPIPNYRQVVGTICLCTRPVCFFCLIHAIELPS